METKDYLDFRYGGVQFVAPRHFQTMKDMENGYQSGRAAGPEDLHISRTLDQSYYSSLIDTKVRDYDQVIYRYTERRTKIQHDMVDNTHAHRGDASSVSDTHSHRDGASLLTADGTNLLEDMKVKANPQLLMVNSIWIWKFGSKLPLYLELTQLQMGRVLTTK
jgi:hypothetical protein